MRFAYLSLAAIALAAASPAMSQNLIVNGDFSSGLDNWSLTNQNAWFIDGNGFRDGTVGQYSYLSQSFTDVAGGLLTVDFDFYANANGQFIEFNGVEVPGTFTGPADWTHYSFALGTATGFDTLTFRGRNDPSYNALTHVVVTESAVPETASWALMLGGFGMVGGAMRRRKSSSVTFA